MYVIYRLRFDDGTQYVGQTSKLNERLSNHTVLWRRLYGLKIEKIDILDTASTEREALVKEAKYIEHFGLENLRNSAFRAFDEDYIQNLSDRLAAEEEPISPDKLIQEEEMLREELKLKYLQKRLTQLENRYLKTYMEYQRMKDNMKSLDIIIDEAIMEQFG